jgi:glutaredoxin-like protein
VALLSAQDRGVVQTHLAGMTHDVALLFFTQTIGGPESALIARQIIDELAEMSDRVSVEEVNFVIEKDRAQAFNVEGVPALVLLRDGEDTRIRFLGAPAGYEFMSLVEAVALAGGDDSGLTQESKALIAAHVTEPIDIKVFVTPTCPHCPRAVTLAHRMAFEHPSIRATCVEATEFIDLSRKYNVTSVPKTVINGAVEIMGAMPEAELVRLAVVGESGASDSPTK